MLDEFWKEISEFENAFEYSSTSNTKHNANDLDYNRYNSNIVSNTNGKWSNMNQEKKNLEWNNDDLSRYQFQNDHIIFKALNREPNINIENLQMTSKCHICDNPVSKRHSIEDLRLFTENKILTESVNQIMNRTDDNTQTQEIKKYFEKSKNELVKL